MRKILLSFIATSAIFYSANAQTKISFEASEGYNLGTLEGQKSWSMWGDSVEEMFQVNNQFATDGVNSYRLESDGYYTGDMMGIESEITAFNKTDLSFDLKIDGLDGSDQSFDLYDSDYNVIASFYFSYDGIVNVYNGEEYIEVGSWVDNVVYKIKYNVDFTSMKVKYYLNDVLLLTGDIDGATSLNILDLTTDNFEGGYVVDNIQIKDASLATAEVSSKGNFRVYPNPTVDVVNFDITGKISSVEVYDVAGKLVKTVKDGAKSINVTTLAKGAYIIKVQTENTVYTGKVIKK